MFNKAFSDIQYEDIEKLVNETKIPENETLDYKKTIENTDKGKREICKDIVAFANTKWWYIIVWVEEEGSVPTEISNDPTIDVIDLERLDQVVYGSLNPAPEFKVKSLSKEWGWTVTIIYISEWYQKPYSTRDKNGNYIEYIRHGTISEQANPYEKREMYDSTSRNKQQIEGFLHEKRLLDPNDPNFAVNNQSIKLYNSNGLRIPLSPKIPLVVISFIPTVLNHKRFDASIDDFIQWLRSNGSGYSPSSRADIFWHYVGNFGYHSIDGLTIYSPGYDNGNDSFNWYYEFLDNGYIETGLSDEIFRFIDGTPEMTTWKTDHYTRDVIDLFKLTWYVQMLLGFVNHFYKSIWYFWSISMQISFQWVKNYILLHLLPQQLHYARSKTYPYCRINSFKIIETINLSELSSDIINDITSSLFNQMARAFGSVGINYLDPIIIEKTQKHLERFRD